jgi:hypothetical protein
MQIIGRNVNWKPVWTALFAAWAAMATLILSGCADSNPNKPSGIDSVREESPAEVALKHFVVELARTSAGDVLAQAWGNHKIGLLEQYDNPDSAEAIILRDHSCATPQDPTNWWDWQVYPIGNTPGGKNNSPLSRWGKINRGKCGGNLDFQFLVITFKHKAADPFPVGNLRHVLLDPDYLTSRIAVNEGRIRLKVSDLPVRESW